LTWAWPTAVEKSGTWYAYKGEKDRPGCDNSCEFLRENPDVRLEIENKVRTELVPLLPVDEAVATKGGKVAEGRKPEKADRTRPTSRSLWSDPAAVVARAQPSTPSVNRTTSVHMAFDQPSLKGRVLRLLTREHSRLES
jgi:hypothetical protein